jgi:hypothetical protein
MVADIVGIAQNMAQSRLQNDFQMSAVKKALDMQKQEGAQMLRLLEVSAASAGEPGNILNTFA